MENYITIEVNDEFLYSLYKATHTRWYFDNLLKRGFEGYNFIKFKNDNDFYVWLEDIKIDGECYKGTLVGTDEEMSIKLHSLIDWMIINNNRMIGGYTIRHYHEMISEEEKRKIEIESGYRIDKGADFFKEDRSTAEGAIITLENYYYKKDLEGIYSCKDFKMEAKNILREQCMDLTHEIIEKLAAVLKISLVEEFEKYEYPNFQEIERIFTLLIEENNQKLIEEMIVYPDGSVSTNKLWVGFSDSDGWKVLNRIE